MVGRKTGCSRCCQSFWSTLTGFSIRFKVFQLLVRVIELRFPDCPNAYGSAREQAELLCRVPLKNAASDVEDSSKFAKTGMVVSDDDDSSKHWFFE